MKYLLIAAAGALSAACLAQAGVGASPSQYDSLDEALAGREAEAPVDCVAMRDLRGNRSIDDVIVFGSRSRERIYVNRPEAGCPSLNNRAFATRTSSTRLCRGDVINIFDPGTRAAAGVCSLGEFTPYRRTSEGL